MTQARTIKKYPNRRLYDTAESRYITLSDVRQLVLGGVAFTVTEQKTGADITRTILLQVICDQESCGSPVLTTRFLEELIRAAERNAHGLVGSYLEQSLQLFTGQQDELRTRVADLLTDRAGAAHDLAADNWARWMSLQRDVFSLVLEQCAAPSGQACAKDGRGMALNAEDGADERSREGGNGTGGRR